MRTENCIYLNIDTLRALNGQLGSPHLWTIWGEHEGRKKCPMVFNATGMMYPIKWKDRNEFATFDEALNQLRSAQNAGHDVKGLGLMFPQGCGLGYIDLDGCIDSELEMFTASWAEEIYDRFETYAEVSASGSGLHLILSGAPEQRSTARKSMGEGHVEIGLVNYGFLVVTGDIWCDREMVNDCGEQYTSLYSELKEAPGLSHQNHDLRVFTPPSIEAAEKLLECTAGGSAWNSFYNEYSGPTEKGARSEWSMRLCNVLAFVCGRDENFMLDLFLRSAFNKATGYFDEKSHAVKHDIAKAAKQCVKVYRWGETIPWDIAVSDLNVFPHPKVNTRDVITGLKATTENFQKLFELYGIKPTFNAIRKEMQVEPSDRLPQIGNAIARVESLCALNGMAKTSAAMQLEATACEHSVNPVLDYLRGLSYSGDGYIQQLANCIIVPDDQMEVRDIVLRLWLIQACAAADMSQSTPNRDAVAKYEYVFVLHGQQGKNKTKFINQLLPKEMNDYIKDGVSIDPSNRDSVWKALGFWIVELGELDTTFRRSDMSLLKAFLSEQMDIMRLPYGRAFMKFKRQTVYAGSVNDMEFLRDSTGNRRYWPVTAVKIRLPIDCGLDINKVWAEAWKLYQEGAQWWPSEAQEDKIERIRVTNFEDRPLSVIGERLSELYPDLSPEIKDIYGTERLRASDLMVRLDIIAPTKNEFKDLKNWMMRRNTKPDGTPDYINHQTTHWILPLPTYHQLIQK